MAHPEHRRSGIRSGGRALELLRVVVPVLFCGALVALEILRALDSLEDQRDRHRDELIGLLERQHARLALEVEGLLVKGTEHAAHLARSPLVLDRLLDAPGRDGALERELLPYLVSFPGIDRICVLDAEGRELVRCERMGGGAAILPRALLELAPRSEVVALARSTDPGEVAVSRLVDDAERVEVTEENRKVLHYVAQILHGEDPLGTVVVTVYAAPLLRVLRELQPFPGVSSALLDSAGSSFLRATEGGDRTGASPAPWSPATLPAILGGEPRFDTAEATVLSSPLRRGPAPFLVSAIPAPALEAAVAPPRGELARVIATTVVITTALALGSALFVRANLRARRLTREREMEEQVQMAERLSSLGLLTAGVAHEINNPLEGIGNYLSLLERPDLPESRRRDYLAQVRVGLQRIQGIVGDLLHASRPTLDNGTADLALVVRRALELARYAKELRHVEVAVRGLDAPLEIPGSQRRLEQVVLNLLLNAGRAMDGQGRITIVATTADPDSVELAVGDEGPGIPEEDLPRMFDPFFSRGGGTGLGLSVSYGIVKAHGGVLRARNRLEGGAELALWLPRRLPQHARPRASSE